MPRFGFLGWLVGLHFLCYMGLGRVFPLETRVVAYPSHFLEMWQSGTLLELLPPLWMTLWYLLLATMLACVLLLALRRLPVSVLQVLGTIPAFVGTLVLIFFTIQIGRNVDLGLWLDGNHPLMQAILALTLALPIAARGAGILKQRTLELQAAQFSQVSRSMGIAEPRVRHKAFRAALPEGAVVLAGEALGLVASLMLIEGMMSFPGIGKAAFTAFAGVSEGVGGTTPEDVRQAVSSASASLMLLFAVAGFYAAVFGAVMQKLDPRLRR